MEEQEKKQNTPVLVFYLDRELMSEKSIIKGYMDEIQKVLVAKNSNIIAIFLPTDGEERVECVNPILYKEGDMKVLNELIEEMKANFDIGQGADEGKLD